MPALFWVLAGINQPYDNNKPQGEFYPTLTVVDQYKPPDDRLPKLAFGPTTAFLPVDVVTSRA